MERGPDGRLLPNQRIVAACKPHLTPTKTPFLMTVDDLGKGSEGVIQSWVERMGVYMVLFDTVPEWPIACYPPEIGDDGGIITVEKLESLVASATVTLTMLRSMPHLRLGQGAVVLDLETLIKNANDQIAKAKHDDARSRLGYAPNENSTPWS